MQRWVVWLVVGSLPWIVGCRQKGAAPAVPGVSLIPRARAAEATPAALGSAGVPGERTAEAARAVASLPPPESRSKVPPATAPGSPPPADPATAPDSPPPTEPAPPVATKPRPRAGKEIVIAWEASLLYRLKDGKMVGEPLILNGAEFQYLRPQHLGRFRITDKSRLKRSNLYNTHGKPLPSRELAESQGAIMRNWMRIGDLAVGLHYSPAFRFRTAPKRRHRSHGCYRMSRKGSKLIFDWAPPGTPVSVVRSLGGTEWAFLRDRTPSHLITGKEPAPPVVRRPKRGTRSRAAGARAGRGPAVSTTPAVPLPASPRRSQAPG